MDLGYRSCQFVFLGRAEGADVFDFVHGHFEIFYEVAIVEGVWEMGWGGGFMY